MKTIVRRPIVTQDDNLSLKLEVIILRIQNAFGNVLKGIRNKKNLTQEELAHKYDLDRTYISLLERGLRQPSLITLFQLGKALDLKPSKIVANVEDKLKKQCKLN